MSERPKLLNARTASTSELSDAVWIDRRSPWGNPFRIGVHGTRDEVCDLYEQKRLPTLDVEPLRGKSLICWCAPKRCHGHSIFKKLYGTAEWASTTNQ